MTKSIKSYFLAFAGGCGDSRWRYGFGWACQSDHHRWGAIALSKHLARLGVIFDRRHNIYRRFGQLASLPCQSREDAAWAKSSSPIDMFDPNQEGFPDWRARFGSSLTASSKNQVEAAFWFVCICSVVLQMTVNATCLQVFLKSPSNSVHVG